MPTASSPVLERARERSLVADPNGSPGPAGKGLARLAIRASRPANGAIERGAGTVTEFPPEIAALRSDLAQHAGEEVTVVAYLTPRPGKEAALEELLLSLVEPTRKEPGCIDYDLHRSNDEPCVFLYYENWRSKEDLDEHLAMPHLETFFARKEELLAKEIDVKLFTMRSAPPA
jgi:quinol monooxygenase YgiN